MFVFVLATWLGLADSASAFSFGSRPRRDSSSGVVVAPNTPPPAEPDLPLPRPPTPSRRTRQLGGERPVPPSRSSQVPSAAPDQQPPTATAAVPPAVAPEARPRTRSRALAPLAQSPVQPGLAERCPSSGSQQSRPVAQIPPASGARVVLIGDSHTVGPFGQQLRQRMDRDRVSYCSYAAVGTSSSQWRGSNVRGARGQVDVSGAGCDPRTGAPQGTAPGLAQLGSVLEPPGQQPPTVVISLGTNMIGQSAEQIRADAVTLMSRVSHRSPCVWVGPPVATAPRLANNLHRTVCALKQAAESQGCRFIDSTRSSPASGLAGDGYHYTPVGGQQWADGVMSELRNPPRHYAEPVSLPAGSPGAT